MSYRWVHFLGTIQTDQTEAEIEKVFGKPVCFEYTREEEPMDIPDRYFHEFCPKEREALEKFKKGEGILPGLEWHYIDTYKWAGHTACEGALVTIEGDIPDILYEIDGGIQKVIDWFINGVKAINARESMLKIDEELSDEIILITGQFDKTQVRRFKKINEFRKEDD